MSTPTRGRARLGQRRSIYIHDAQWTELVADAKAQDRTINATIRRAIAAYLVGEDHPGGAAKTALEESQR